MELKIKSFTFRLDFTFLILLSFAVLYGYESAVQIILFSILHELGHIIMLLIFGARPTLIKLSFYGIGMKYEKHLSKIKELFVLLCGPAVNLALYIFFGNEINLMLFLLNMFPVTPLDGGRIVRLLFPKFSVVLNLILLIAAGFLSGYLLFEYKIFSLLLITAYLLYFNIDDFKSFLLEEKGDRLR